MSNENLAIEDRIAGRINSTITGQTGLTKSGAMSFNSVEQIMEFAKVMSIASVAIPKHLRANPGACLAVAIQASEWEMSPFSVANKSYVVNDRIAYEAQLINAVILRRAPIVGRFKISYSGTEKTRRCKVVAKLTDGDLVEYESPEIGKIPVQNSPLWKGDPDQQLFYYSSRAMCRRHFPDVLLGVYAVDEIQDTPEIEATVTRPTIDTTKSEAPKPAETPAPKEEPKPKAKKEKAPEKPTVAELNARADEAEAKAYQGEIHESNAEPTPAERLSIALEEAGKTWDQALPVLVAQGLAKPGWQPSDLADKVIAMLLSDLAGFVAEIDKAGGAK